MEKFSLVGNESVDEKTDLFLRCKDQFQLGQLMTEASHPDTRELSEWANNDLDQALKKLKLVNQKALAELIEKSEPLIELQIAIRDTLKSGGRIFMSGCGATGRLSLTLEYLWRHMLPLGPDESERVISFMAGGDLALIRSIESFEDHQEFGAEQLMDLGFTENDLLIGVTEGGETSFVIGSVKKASEMATRRPFFLYCNPQEMLCELVQRSKQTIEDPAIRSICLDVGPMSLSGSTRMQASTVILLAVGASLLYPDLEKPSQRIIDFAHWLESIDTSFLKEMVLLECETYQKNECVIYATDEYGMTILTDTTERSPTFSLVPFENFDDQGDKYSLVYFRILETDTSEKAWNQLLLRGPRAIQWPRYVQIAGPQRLPGYDFSEQCVEKRKKSTQGRAQNQFTIVKKTIDNQEMIHWNFRGFNYNLPVTGHDAFFQHLMIKVLLNDHSTALMGRMNRYEGNWMTWVKPSNGKLIDRAARYVLSLAQARGLSYEYDQVVRQIFVDSDGLKPDEPIVVKVLASLQKKTKN